MNQQEAYRKIEQRLAIFKVLLNAGVISGKSLKTDAVSNAVDHNCFQSNGSTIQRHRYH